VNQAVSIADLKGLHRVGWFENIVPDRGWGSIPQPLQEFASIDPAEGSGRPVVGAEVIPETMLFGSVCRFDPVDGPVLRIGDGVDQFREGHGVRFGSLSIDAKKGGQCPPVVSFRIAHSPGWGR